jgi:hypothetical protein
MALARRNYQGLQQPCQQLRDGPQAASAARPWFCDKRQMSAARASACAVRARAFVRYAGGGADAPSGWPALSRGNIERSTSQRASTSPGTAHSF